MYIWRLVSIGPILNKIQLFINLKIYIKRCMDCWTHCPDVYYFLVNFGVFEWLYLVQYRPDIKLENAANFNVLFFWLYGSRVVYPIINRLVPSLSRFETRQWQPWILDSIPWIPVSSYWIPVFVSGIWILDSLSCHVFRIPEPSIPDSTSN